MIDDHGILLRTKEEVIVYGDPAVLLLDDRYLPKVTLGQKTTTIRTKVRVFPPNCKIRLQCTSSGMSIDARVKGTRVLLFRDLTDEDAKKDGFSRKESLRREILTHYPNVVEETVITVVELELTME